jgi:hypothetical protein
VLKKRKLRKIFEHKRDQLTADYRALYSEQLHNLFPKPDIIRVIKENQVGGTCEGGGGREKNTYRIWWGKTAEKDKGVERTIMVKCIL